MSFWLSFYIFLNVRKALFYAELKHGHYDNFFDSEEEWLEYELEKLGEYITEYINGKSIEISDLYPIKEFIQHLKFKKILVLHPARNRTHELPVSHHCVVKISRRWTTSPSEFCLALDEPRSPLVRFLTGWSTRQLWWFIQHGYVWGKHRGT